MQRKIISTEKLNSMQMGWDKLYEAAVKCELPASIENPLALFLDLNQAVVIDCLTDKNLIRQSGKTTTAFHLLTLTNKASKSALIAYPHIDNQRYIIHEDPLKKKGVLVRNGLLDTDYKKTIINDVIFTLENMPKGRIFAFGGSLMSDITASDIDKIMLQAKSRNLFTVVDFSLSLSKDQFLSILNQNPKLIKPNLEEFEIICRCANLLTDNHHLQADRYREIQYFSELLSNTFNIPYIIVTLGKDGAVMFSRNETIHGSTKLSRDDIKAQINTGDAFLGGIVSALLKENPSDLLSGGLDTRKLLTEALLLSAARAQVADISLIGDVPKTKINITDIKPYTNTFKYLSVIKGRLDTKKVALISLGGNRIPFAGESLGINMMAGYLKQKYPNAEVSIFDTKLANFDKVIDYIQEKRPALLGFSVKLTSFFELLYCYEQIKKHIPREDRPLFVIGNYLANSLSDILLKYYLPKTVVGLGEGEISLSDLYRLLNEDRFSINDLRNVVYLTEDNQIVRKEISLLPPQEWAHPDRSLTLEAYNRGGIVYMETARGCPHGKCSICSRLQDPQAPKDHMQSRFNSWRGAPIDYVLKEFDELQTLGVSAVRIADEEFFGGGTKGILRAIEIAEKKITRRNHVQFDIIARVDAIYSTSDDEGTKELREQMLIKLVGAGLTKIALGVESFHDTQLKIYKKGIRLADIQGAIKLLQKFNKEYGLDWEIGFIPVDFFSTTEGIEITLNNLVESGALPYASIAFKEIRVQKDTRMYSMIKAQEKKHNQRFLGPLDLNSLNYPVIRYLNDDVNLLAEYMRAWNHRNYELFYQLRIYNQYSPELQKDRDIFKDIDPNVFLELHKQLKDLELVVFKKIIAVIKLNQENLDIAKKILVRKIYSFEVSRKKMIMDVLDKVTINKTSLSDFFEDAEIYFSRLNELEINIE